MTIDPPIYMCTPPPPPPPPDSECRTKCSLPLNCGLSISQEASVLFVCVGNEWVHWGYPPCGAKCHMLFVCVGNEWVHWGYPPCGAKCHMLFVCVGNEWVHWGYPPCGAKCHMLFVCVGNEWVHWGYPPCGAKRHMDLMSTSRVSVQIRGTKHWRFYPILSENELSHLSLSNWTKVRYVTCCYQWVLGHKLWGHCECKYG